METGNPQTYGMEREIYLPRIDENNILSFYFEMYKKNSPVIYIMQAWIKHSFVNV